MPISPIFEKKNILVAGGAGFIGTFLCEELLRKNKVICVDNFSTGNRKNIEPLLQYPDFKFINHDIIEPLDLERLPELEVFKIKFQGVQEIYNLACPTAPKNFEKNKIATALSNSAGMRNVLELAVKYKAKFLQFSSSVVYGSRPDDSRPFVESDRGVVDFIGPR
ncbi:MAG: GDP-mannose 4,6-dehydratase, partial [Candidatus Doudnabacteria bacterium]|nr:GDP-mannose 4,6-dehydratase [Candidatus Doudnabacteria bacterium]